MYAEERQQAIADLIAVRGRVSVAELAEEYAVTTETVRRDLSQLERAGVVRRVHGGAVPAQALTVLEPRVAERDLSRGEEKDRIAKAALDLLPRHGGSVLLDAGTTTARVAARIPRELELTVVTNSVPIAALLADRAHIELHLLPGRVRATTQAAVGEDTVEALGRLRTDVAILGANAFSADHGFSTPDHSEAAAKRAMVAAGQRVAVLADSSKAGLENLVRFAAVDDVDVLVTDTGVPERVVDALTRRDVEVVVA